MVNLRCIVASGKGARARPDADRVGRSYRVAGCMKSRILSVLVMALPSALSVGSHGAEPNAEASGQTEILRVTVGKETFLSPERYQNCSSLAVSRTGVVAAFYPKPGTGPRFYRTSSDGGTTWGPEKDSPRLLEGGAESVALHNGGVLKLLTPGPRRKAKRSFTCLRWTVSLRTAGSRCIRRLPGSTTTSRSTRSRRSGSTCPMR